MKDIYYYFSDRSDGDKTLLGQVTEDNHLNRAREILGPTPRKGVRETFINYRGQCIITQKSTGGTRHVAYLYLTKDKFEDTFCVTAGLHSPTLPKVKKLIDKILETGKYYYGMQPD